MQGLGLGLLDHEPQAHVFGGGRTRYESLEAPWGFPKIRGTILGLGFRVPITGILVYWGLYWGPLVLGNYHKFHVLRKEGTHEKVSLTHEPLNPRA